MRSKHTEEQLAWLKNHLPKYEQKTSGATRGDAKKFALDCAQTYIQLWGLPKTANGDDEKESVVKEVRPSLLSVAFADARACSKSIRGSRTRARVGRMRV